MNIFLSFLQSEKKYAIPAYDFWPFYLKNGIEEAGHHWSECQEIDWALGLVPGSKKEIANWKSEAWAKTVSYLKKEPADLFLSYLYPHMVDMAAIEEIKRMGIPCINFYCDHLRDFRKLPPEFSVFNLNWVPEFKAVKLYQKANFPYIHLPMPIWVEPRLRILRPEKYKQVTFIGSRDIQRQLFLQKVIEHDPDISLAVYGKDWAKTGDAAGPSKNRDNFPKRLQHQLSFIAGQGLTAYLRKIKHLHYNTPVNKALNSKIKGTVDFEQYNELTAGSTITIGINRYPSFHHSFFEPDTYSRLRDIEAPMLGACYLTEWTEGIDELYVPGEEIETFRDEDEFIGKVRELEINGQKRRSLKEKGQKRALQAHSIPTSLNRILCELSL